MTKIYTMILILLTLIGVTACGLKGDLELPDEQDVQAYEKGI